MRKKPYFGLLELAVGFLFLLAGLFTFIRPMTALQVHLPLYGALAVCSGIFEVALYLACERKTGCSASILFLMGLCNMILGFLLIAGIGQIRYLTGVVIPLWLLLFQAGMLLCAKRIRRAYGPFLGLVCMVAGIAGIAISLFLLLFPAAAVLAQAFVIGLGLNITGISLILFGLSHYSGIQVIR